MSTSQNPFEDSPSLNSGQPPEILPPLGKPPVEDPPFSGVDVAVIVGVTIAAMFILPTLLIGVLRLVAFKNLPLKQVAEFPMVVLVNQLLLYTVIFLAMYNVLRMRRDGFWSAIRWNWPAARWIVLLFSGALLYLSLAGLGSLLPIPKHLPIDDYFKTARDAAMFSTLSVTLAPLMEELFFRGLLYPVLARRYGMGASILLTGAAFGLLHGAQLKFSWAVLIIFLVGIALTAVRAKTKSVAASFLMHVGYNATLSILFFVATGGFRHLDQLNR